ncbi:hypothetical protein METBIDRAFT_29634 [Metschnikowia bicuspidata var. bicuspidata NRRL YB-4993]|uniref:Ceramide glucosyltransferase n=1 Tax=Metschnikowia bicuspidata var. bicuspidata NRRL YB-4993 TaxID=869754 RepID=A0A1A0HGG9_9ASCO|nr:hypothetical protein METBIDRAFT_29634 [Metschnikowia bicuspidata var. bicuspidata NRRL YB-4993]OBA23101.1 hypothetical protein METBIDRAFT_29634 [Metschnikowia bicuspidata var. bicuspidata NRRL YB-4993]
MFAVVLAYIFLLWYAVMLTAALCGFYSIYANFDAPPDPPLPQAHGPELHGSASCDPDSCDPILQDPEAAAASAVLEPVTIIRPVKGLDPELTSCLELSFLQSYPANKLQIIFCVADAHDPAIPVLQGLLAKYPHIDAQILVLAPDGDHFGPNPKVNNLAKGFLAAAHDLVWIMDLNVWASQHLLANSAAAMAHNTNCGTRLGKTGRRVKLVHHVPLALALGRKPMGTGSLLDEMFLFTSHLKFYVSLNNLSIAPCVNGKSNLYRRSDLDFAVLQIPLRHSPFFCDPHVVLDARQVSRKGPGHAMEFFAKYIGEDNMIAIALWEFCAGRTALTGDIVIQPLAAQNPASSVREYCNRRVRWLRVRKYMVLAATLVEPTTESLVCGLMGTYALSKLFWGRLFSLEFFAFHMACWFVCDYTQYHIWAQNITATLHGPLWLRGIDPSLRSKWQWLKIWIMRELLALPIWLAAMVGHEIEWRGKPFMIKKDLSVEEL